MLKDNRYFIEVVDKATKKKLLEIEQVKQAYEQCVVHNKMLRE